MHGILAAHADQLLPCGLAVLYCCVPCGIVWTHLYIAMLTKNNFVLQSVVIYI